jgi:hypothetical protein
MVIFFQERAEGGEPLELAPGFFSFPCIRTLKKGGVMFVHLQLLKAETPPYFNELIIVQAPD